MFQISVRGDFESQVTRSRTGRTAADLATSRPSPSYDWGSRPLQLSAPRVRAVDNPQVAAIGTIESFLPLKCTSGMPATFCATSTALRNRGIADALCMRLTYSVSIRELNYDRSTAGVADKVDLLTRDTCGHVVDSLIHRLDHVRREHVAHNSLVARKVPTREIQHRARATEIRLKTRGRPTAETRATRSFGAPPEGSVALAWPQMERPLKDNGIKGIHG